MKAIFDQLRISAPALNFLHEVSDSILPTAPCIGTIDGPVKGIAEGQLYLIWGFDQRPPDAHENTQRIKNNK